MPAWYGSHCSAEALSIKVGLPVFCNIICIFYLYKNQDPINVHNWDLHVRCVALGTLVEGPLRLIHYERQRLGNNHSDCMQSRSVTVAVSLVLHVPNIICFFSTVNSSITLLCSADKTPRPHTLHAQLLARLVD